MNAALHRRVLQPAAAGGRTKAKYADATPDLSPAERAALESGELRAWNGEPDAQPEGAP